MKRKQIIKIMQKGFEEMACREASKSELNYFKESADAILALPLDVPSDEEIKKTALDYAPVYYLAETNDDVNDQIREEVEDLLKDLRDEIIKRNTKK